MENWKEYFTNKRVTMMGLGLLGRGINIAKFLAGNGVDLIITDLKSEEILRPALEELDGYTNIKYVLGEHRPEDFENRDLIIKAAGVPKNSQYIEHAKNNGIPIEMDASLFIKLAPKGIKTIGITGTRGKSTVTQMIYEIVKESGKKVFLGGNVRGLATLPLLEEVEDGDVVVMELDSWQLQGFGDSKISPQIAVFTNFLPDHQNYYEGMDDYFADKANIFKYQNPGDDLIIYEQVHERVVNEDFKSDLFIVREDNLADLNLKVLGHHNLVNASLALAVANSLEISDEVARKTLENFKSVEGRLQFIKDIDGVAIYNDNNATTPDATIAGLKALGENIVLIMGGADKGLDMSHLVSEIKERVKFCVMLSGTGTDKVKEKISEVVEVKETNSLEEAVRLARLNSNVGEKILFSPAFASFGLFRNEYDRNDQFLKIVNSL